MIRVFAFVTVLGAVIAFYSLPLSLYRNLRDALHYVRLDMKDEIRAAKRIWAELHP